MLQRQIIREVKESDVFSVIADENQRFKERITTVFSCIVLSTEVLLQPGTSTKSFLHFQSAESLDAAGLTQMIIEIP